MLLTAQIWDAQKQELAGRVGATSRRIASKVAEVLHAGKTATRRQGYRFKLGTKTSGVTVGRCPLCVKSGLMQCNNAGPLGDNSGCLVYPYACIENASLNSPLLARAAEGGNVCRVWISEARTICAIPPQASRS